MATRRKLNIQQLVTLSEVYWDDAAKLAEIVEELRSRLEPEAEALFRTVTGRIHLLKTNPAAAREQPPPTQRAQDEEAVAPPVSPAEPRSRVRLAVIGGAVVAAGVAVWLLWPRSPPPPIAVKPTTGPEVALGGVQADEPTKSSAEDIAPPSGAPRRAALERPDMPGRSEPGGGGGGGSGGGSGSGGAGFDGSAAHRPLAKPRAAEKEVPEPADATEQAFTKETSELDTAERPSPLASPNSAGATRTSRAKSVAGSRAGAPEAGIAIDDAQLACYRTDSRPGSCGSPPAPADTAAPESRAPPERDEPAQSAPAAGGGGAGASPPQPAPARAASRAGSPSKTPSASPAAAAASPAGGAGAGPAGGGGAGAGGGGGGSSPAGSSAKTAASPTQKPSPPLPTDPDAVATAAAAPPNCPPAPESGRVVFILDGSVSMGLPLDVDADLEDALDDGIRRHDPKARQEYRALLAEPGPKRITRAREAFAAAAADLPPKIELGLVVFQECRDIRKIGIFNAARRDKAIDYIRAMVPHGRTPIADSLRRAAEMLGKGASSIVLLTDGREFCGGDPCAAAAEIKAAHPQTPVSIVDITGQAKAECVAEITGGHSYKPEAADDLARVVSAAFRGADPLCAAGAETDAQVGMPKPP